MKIGSQRYHLLSADEQGSVIIRKIDPERLARLIYRMSDEDQNTLFDLLAEMEIQAKELTND